MVLPVTLRSDVSQDKDRDNRSGLDKEVGTSMIRGAPLESAHL